MHRTIRTLAALAAGAIPALARPVAAAPFSAAVAPAPPIVIFLWNHDEKDGFMNACESYVWKRLFLMDDNYIPGTIQANGEIHDGQGNRLGYVIRDNNNAIIGLRNNTQDEEGYDLKSGFTADQAWQRLATNGKLIIMCHGGYQEKNGTRLEGGGIELNNRTLYDGVKDTARGTGTNAGFGNGAYAVAQRNGATTTWELNACWSSKDPDGAATTMTSVKASAAAVTGVSTVRGQNGVVRVQFDFDLMGGSAAQREAARNRIMKAAKDDKFVNKNTGEILWRAWAYSHPLSNRHTKFNAVIDNNAITVRYSYILEPDPSSPAGGGGENAARGTGESTGGEELPLYTQPALIWPPQPGQTVVYRAYDMAEGAPAEVIVNDASLAAPTMFHINQLSDLPSAAPRPFRASGVFDFRHNGASPSLAGTVEYRIRSFGDARDATLYWFNGAWMPVAAQIEDGDYLVAHLPNIGLLAAFSDEPPFGPPGDLDGNGVVNITDLLILLSMWGPCPQPCTLDCMADLNTDCFIDVGDLLLMLANWG